MGVQGHTSTGSFGRRPAALAAGGAAHLLPPSPSPPLPHPATLCRLIEDGDLWHWQLEGARAFHAGFRALNIDMDATQNPSVFERLQGLSTQDVIAVVGALDQCLSSVWVVLEAGAWVLHRASHRRVLSGCRA